MKINLDNQSDEARIEIVPLIDVIFCILTFFILAAVGLTRQQAITVDLPKASNATAPEISSRLLVSINPYNQIYVENQLVPPEQLQQKLQEFNQQNPQGLMVLYASKTAFYNDVVQVLDKMQAVGGDRVALATLPDSEGTQPSPALPGQTPNTGSTLPPTLPPPTGIPGATTYPGTYPPPTGIPGATTYPGTLPPPTGTPGVTPYPGTYPSVPPAGSTVAPETTAPTPNTGKRSRSRRN